MMPEKKLTITPAIETALANLVAQSKMSRLSKGIRNLVIDYSLLSGSDRPQWLPDLLEDLLPLFAFCDLTEQALDKFYQFPCPEEE
ncbi:hypothetical protein HGH93_12115 [Chitinophaga polysaccharea]|uniref:hypothetical protein n=1 Tax=Chitinophaga polysaccharea TaxID=1293035 RepID=UPI001455DA2A|nr:hypothetical protein [Chitinophaga polysaccharea]NLR58852.1 hypothetical protein [Chitinophaga polysaccharea]